MAMRMRGSPAYRALGVLERVVDEIRLLMMFVRRPGAYARWYRAEQRDALRAGGRVWVIATGVAQVHVALRFLEEVRRRRPGVTFVLSVPTRVLHTLAQRHAAPDDIVTYVPMPLSIVLRRALALVRPLAVIAVLSVDTPMLLWRAKRRKIPVAWIAAEMSQDNAETRRSFWRRFEHDRVIEALDVLCANTSGDRERLAAAGFAPERIYVAGPAKFDAAAPEAGGARHARDILDAAGFDRARLILLGGSLLEGEQAALLDLYAALKPRRAELALVLAPRDIRHAGETMREIERRGLAGVRRSALRDTPRSAAPPDVLLVDTIGDLKSLYAWAAVVFMGRSLTGRTGSNLMEPAGHGRAIVIGPRFELFKEPLDAFLAADAVCQVADREQLRETVAALLADPDLREEYGRRAAAVVARNAGVLLRTVERLEECGVRWTAGVQARGAAGLRRLTAAGKEQRLAGRLEDR